MRIFILLLLLLIGACGKDTPIDACSSEQGRFVKDTHYIDSNFLSEDKTWNYKAWNEQRKKEARNEPNQNCIPIKQGKSLTEQIEEQEEVIDLMR